MVKLKTSGADVFFNITSPKFAAQSTRKIAEMKWDVMHVMNSTSISMPVMRAAGLENCQGMVSLGYQKDPTDPKWKNEPDFKAWSEWMDNYNTSASKSEGVTAFAYAASYTMHQVLLRCGDELTRENLMKQATNLSGLNVPMLLPGVKVQTTPQSRYPITTVQLLKFSGEVWKPNGETLTATM